MRSFLIGQQNIPGNTDARFTYEDNINLTDYWPVAIAQPGFQYILTGGVERTAKIAHWFRFKLPFPRDGNIEFVKASLQLYWYPNPAFGVEELRRIAEVGELGHIEIGILHEETFPSGQLDAFTKFNSSIKIDWNGPELVNRGRFEGLIVTPSFHLELQNQVIDNLNWDAGEYILIFLAIKNHTAKENKAWNFYTKSWIDAHNLSQKFYPRLSIYYNYNTPGSELVANHVSHSVDVQQFFEDHAFYELVEQNATLVQSITYNAIYNRTLTDYLIIEEDINLKLSQYDVEHFTVIKQDIEVSHLSPVVEQTLSITQDIESYHRNIEQILTIQQVIGPQTFDFDQLLSLAEDIEMDAELIEPEQPENQMNMIQDISYNAIYNRSKEDVMDIEQAVLGWQD